MAIFKRAAVLSDFSLGLNRHLSGTNLKVLQNFHFKIFQTPQKANGRTLEEHFHSESDTIKVIQIYIYVIIVDLYV